MTDDTTENNIFNLVQGGKLVNEAAGTDAIPQNEYLVVDRDGNEYFADGFALFTSHHIAIMRDTGVGALPVLIMPLDRVSVVELVEDLEVFEADEVL